MADNSPPTITVGEELYVELGNESIPQTSQFMEVIRNLKQELTYVRNNNECLIKASEEQERMIRELNEKSSHRSIELEGLKRKEVELESKKFESGGESDRMYSKSQKKEENGLTRRV